jgi:hypothetical protein
MANRQVAEATANEGQTKPAAQTTAGDELSLLERIVQEGNMAVERRN